MSPATRTLAALLGTVGLAPPTVEPGAPGTTTAGHGRASAAEIDSRGGVLTLVAAASSMILVPKSTFTMGSSADDIIATLADCQTVSPGRRCDAARFSDEAPAHKVT